MSSTQQLLLGEGAVNIIPAYIEEVFSTYLYTGNGTFNTNITNNIDLATQGGLVWIKDRASSAYPDHYLSDSARGATWVLRSNTADVQENLSSGLTTFLNNGFRLGDGRQNLSNIRYSSWTFRKQPKFFDIVTYTGNSTYGRTVAHNLGAVPAFIIVKCTSAVHPWAIYHRSLGGTKYMNLNSTAAATTDNAYWNNTDPTSTEFTTGGDGDVNGTGKTYVAYIFAHNAGGFGLTGTDNVISCGSYTGTGAAGNTITLGYEPQWVMIKRASGGTADWRIYDVMRNVGQLEPNTTDAEAGDPLQNALAIQATGFRIVDFTSGSLNANGSSYIYIAIRRGPMKVPTSGTSVFTPLTWTGTGTNNRVLTGVGFPTDLAIFANPNRSDYSSNYFLDRLRTPYTGLRSDATAAETNIDGSTTASFATFGNTSVTLGSTSSAGFNLSGKSFWSAFIGRAPSFFDEVCYTEGSSIYATNHNLGVLPELIIYKTRSAVRDWFVYYKNPSSGTYNRYMALNSSDAANINYEDMSTLTSTTIPAFNYIGSGTTDVAYLFATCAGVSKVFSYTGNGSSQTINCGFTGGARFVLIKRTDSAGDWYVWDSARGIVSGNDPHLSLNTTAAEVTSDDTIDTDSTGFVVNQVSATNVNVSSATYIGLAIA